MKDMYKNRTYYPSPNKTPRKDNKFIQRLKEDLKNEGKKIIRDRIHQVLTTTKTKKKNVKQKSYSGSAQLAGKIKATKLKNKTRKVNGKLTQYGVECTGIVNTFEFRKNISTSGAEAMMIGHTTMPGKQTAINWWRAVIKHLMINMKIEIRDYGNLVTSVGMVVGDIIRFNYYANVETTTISSFTYTVSAPTTFDDIPASFAAQLNAVTFIEPDTRIESIEFLPLSTSRFPGVNLMLHQATITVFTKSILKFQNVTVETDADNEDSDVTRVPLQGRIYNCKGNNIKRTANNEILPGMFSTDNEVALYKGWTRANAAQNSGAIGYYTATAGPTNSLETTFFKTSEMPKIWEIENAYKDGKFFIGPGDIKSSIATQHYTMKLQTLFNILYCNDQAVGALAYNKLQGQTKAIYLEKVVGKSSTASNDIKLWVELEFRQSMVVGGYLNRYTLPITYQANF